MKKGVHVKKLFKKALNFFSYMTSSLPDRNFVGASFTPCRGLKPPHQGGLQPVRGYPELFLPPFPMNP
jgi:hypothetical protein